jgi:DNA-binding response OmpR family regulator
VSGLPGSRREAEAPPPGRRTLLLVDDEPSIRLLCRVNLPFSGFDVIEAADGEEALAQARAHAVDLVVLDVMMPGMNGFEVAERLHSDPATAEIPVVFLSARADEVDVRRGLELGRDYITKPFDPIRLGERLKRIVDGS